MTDASQPSQESLLAKIEQRAAVIFVRGGVLPWFLVVAILVFSISTDNFLSSRNILTMLRQATYLTMVAMAQMVVLLTAGLDLSVGVMFAITSVVSSMVMVGVWSGEGTGWGAIALGCAAGMGAGTLVGVFNGIGVAIFRVPPFMMTLAMASIVFGIALTITGGTPIYGMPTAFAEIFGYGKFITVPVPVWLTIAFIILMYVFINWSRMGRYLYALGGNLKRQR